MKLKNLGAAAFAAASVASAMAQSSGEGPWLLRLRATQLDMANKTTASAAALDLNVNNKTIAEVDVSYFFNRNFAAELMLTVPQQQTVQAGATPLGTFKHLPLTLLAQYHFTDFSGFKPYLGAGINYTKITGVNLDGGVSLNPLALDSHSWGGALQAGVDIPLDRNWSLNFDVKKIYLRTDVYSQGVNVGTLKLDPVAASIGLGYRF